jgi:ankyrin repeat protein
VARVGAGTGGKALPSLDTVQILAELRPESLLEQNSEGRTPLHVAVAREKAPKKTLRLARMLVEHCPESLGVADASGSTPLHAVVSRQGASLALARLLVEARPASLQRNNARGLLTFHHLSAEPGAPLYVVFYLPPHDVARVLALGSERLDHIACRLASQLSSAVRTAIFMCFQTCCAATTVQSIRYAYVAGWD